MYLYSILEINIDKSYFYNNKVNFDKSLKRNQKFSNYTLTQGGAIYYKPENINSNLNPQFQFTNSEISFSQASSGGGIMIIKKME